MKTGKNRYYKNSRIAEAKFRQLLKAFAMDLTATDAAELTGLSVRRINDIYIKLRRRIAQFCEQQSPFQGEVEVDGAYFGPKHVPSKSLSNSFEHQRSNSILNDTKASWRKLRQLGVKIK